MDSVHIPKGKIVERCSREDIVVERLIEGEDAPRKVFSAVEETLQVLRISSDSFGTSQETYRELLLEAIDTIESLQKRIDELTQPPKTSPTEDTPTIEVILQEIRDIKSTVTQIQSPKYSPAPTWAKVAGKGVKGTKIRIEDEMEKHEIAELTSEELVKRIGREEVIGARQLGNGQVKVYFTGEDTQQTMMSQRDWTQKLSSTAHVAMPSFQVLVHNMPFSFNPDKPEQVLELQQANMQYLQGIKILKAVWLKRNRAPGKASGSLILWFEKAEQADIAISKGVMWKYELKTAEIFRSGFRLIQCFNCQRYGHIARNCTAVAKCGVCAEQHNTRQCTGKVEDRCCNCGRKHRAWEMSCPLRIAAKARTATIRVHDSGRYLAPEDQSIEHANHWQIVGNSKKKSTSSATKSTAINDKPQEPRRWARPTRRSPTASRPSRSASRRSSTASTPSSSFLSRSRSRPSPPRFPTRPTCSPSRTCVPAGRRTVRTSSTGCRSPWSRDVATRWSGQAAPASQR